MKTLSLLTLFVGVSAFLIRAEDTNTAPKTADRPQSILKRVDPTNLVASPTGPDMRDRQVLETLLLHLLTDTKFDMTRVSTNGGTIVLQEKTGFLMSHQIRSEIGNRTLPSDAEGELRRRNTSTDAKSDTFDSVTAFYTNLTFGTGIVVADLTETWKQRRSFNAFAETYPKARGWLESYLPGYSKDGTRAVVRAGIGPWAHGAMLTALLENKGDKWVVRWYHISYYA